MKTPLPEEFMRNHFRFLTLSSLTSYIFSSLLVFIARTPRIYYFFLETAISLLLLIKNPIPIRFLIPPNEDYPLGSSFHFEQEREYSVVDTGYSEPRNLLTHLILFEDLQRTNSFRRNRLSSELIVFTPCHACLVSMIPAADQLFPGARDCNPSDKKSNCTVEIVQRMKNQRILECLYDF